MTGNEIVARAIVHVIEQLIPETSLKGPLAKEDVIRSATNLMYRLNTGLFAPPQTAPPPPASGVTSEWAISSMEWTISDQARKLARAKDDISTLRASAQLRHQERNTAERATEQVKAELAQAIKKRDATIDSNRSFIQQIESMRIHKNQIAVELATREQEISKLRNLYNETVGELSRAHARLTAIQNQFPTPVTETNPDEE